jgi:putative acetyltransferase
MTVRIRPYLEADATGTLDVFIAAVTETAAVDYSPEQVAAWADVDRRNLGVWHAARLAAATIVAEDAETIAGFSDVDARGYIDMLYTHPRFTREGIASALLSEIVQIAIRAGAAELWTNASIAGRPFFEKHDFALVREQHPIVRGVRMVNYRMIRSL